MSDGERLTVTIKYQENSNKYDQPWAVFHGDVQSIREDIIRYFELTDDEHKGLPLHAVVLNARRYAHGLNTFASVLGGAVVEVVEDEPKAVGGQPVEEDWSAPVVTDDDVVASINAATSKGDIKAIYVAHKARFVKGGPVADAYNAKIKELA